jgi:uncharacterized repeat protein (TIGR03803 family)
MSVIGIPLVAIAILMCGSVARAANPTFVTLYSFNGVPDGEDAMGRPLGGNGALYGTTVGGGAGSCPFDGSDEGCGTIFELTPPAISGGQWTESVLHSFTGGPDGFFPYTGLSQGGNGALYGTTLFGGSGQCTDGYPPVVVGCGTAFELSPPVSPGGSWTKTVIYSFPGTDAASSQPSGLVIDKNGSMYGTTVGGGASNAGTVFKLNPPVSPSHPWTETTIYSFAGGSDGSGPSAGVTFGRDDSLYGTTSLGGASNCGTVFQLTPPSSPGGDWEERPIHTFAYDAGGYYPYKGVVVGSGGSLYGTTNTADGQGTVFELTPPSSPGGAWAYSVLLSFDSVSLGFEPVGLAIGAGGVLYGATSTGGTGCPFGCGIIYKLAPPRSPGGAWHQTTLYSFTGGDDGWGPTSLDMSESGILYGTTEFGAVQSPTCGSGCGTVFELRP